MKIKEITLIMVQTISTPKKMPLTNLLNKQEKIALIGLGYVGLPIALAFAKKLAVIGFDINEDRVQMMRQSIDPSNELPKEAFAGCDITFTSSLEELAKATFFNVVGVSICSRLTSGSSCVL